MKVYSVYDSKAEAYLQPFFANTHGLATRMFADAVNDEGSQLYRHPADFTLFHVGEWNERSGEIVPIEVKQPLGLALEYRRSDEQLPMFKEGK